MLIALWTVDLVCMYANGGLVSSSPRWVSSGLSPPPALPGLKASLANGPDARADGGLGRQGRSIALTAEESNRDLSVLMGNGDRGPPPVTRPALGHLLSGTGLMNLTLAPHMPSNSGCPPSSCHGSRRPAGICRGGSWACVLEPSRAAAQRAHVTQPHRPFGRAELRTPSPGPLSEVLLPGLSPPSQQVPVLACPCPLRPT